MKFCIVLHEFYLSGCMATTKPEVVITMRWYALEMQFRRLDIGFRGRQSQWNIDRHDVLYSSAWILPIWCMATTKPEVVITMRRYALDMQFLRLDIGFRGHQSQWNIDRHEVLYSSAWILPIWMHGDHETGSSYNYASVCVRNAISASRHRFSRTPKTMEHRPTWYSV